MVATGEDQRDERKNRRMMKELDEPAEHDRTGDAGEQTDEVRDPAVHDQVDGEDGGHTTEVGLREVQDPIGSIDECHADGHERVEQPEDDAVACRCPTGRPTSRSDS